MSVTYEVKTHYKHYTVTSLYFIYKEHLCVETFILVSNNHVSQGGLTMANFKTNEQH